MNVLPVFGFRPVTNSSPFANPLCRAAREHGGHHRSAPPPSERRTVRAIYLSDTLADPGTADHVRRFAAAGEEVRFAPALPLKLVIADAALVLCDLPDPVAGAGTTTTLFIEHPALAACLRLAFHTVWATARPGPES